LSNKLSRKKLKTRKFLPAKLSAPKEEAVVLSKSSFHHDRLCNVLRCSRFAFA